MGRSGKGFSGAARKEANKRTSTEAVEGRRQGIMFARVLKMLGMNHISVAIPTKAGYKEFQARITPKLGRKGSTPLTINNVVAIYVGEGFDPEEKLQGNEHFDVECILDDKQTYQLFKDGKIPGWMLKSPEEVSSGVVKSTGTVEEGFEFDYHLDGLKEKHSSDEEEEGKMENEIVVQTKSKKNIDRDPVGGAEVTAKKADSKLDFTNYDSVNIDDI